MIFNSNFRINPCFALLTFENKLTVDVDVSSDWQPYVRDVDRFDFSMLSVFDLSKFKKRKKKKARIKKCTTKRLAKQRFHPCQVLQPFELERRRIYEFRP